MIAKITIIDDNGNPKGAYELKPSRIYEGGISTKYVFEFEYNQLEIKKKNMTKPMICLMWDKVEGEE